MGDRGEYVGVCRNCHTHGDVREFYAVSLRVVDEPIIVELCRDCLDAGPHKDDWRLVATVDAHD